jgi:hypothetical protein
MVIDLEQKINTIHKNRSDINEHIPTIVELARECDHITEMGVRTVVSTWAWLAGAPKNGLFSYDLYNPKKWLGENLDPIKDVKDTAEAYGIKFKFTEADVCEIEIEETDLLFIDTWHVYDQLKEELKLHSNKAKKYICFHDTTSFEHHGESNSSDNKWVGKLTPNKGVWDAVSEFLDENSDIWELKKRYKNNNGFTIIKRK